MKKLYILLILLSIIGIIIFICSKSYYYLEGIKIPKHIKTDHQHFQVNSPEHKQYMYNELNTLSEFHKFCIDNNILYTLHAGSLIGCLKIGKPLPWDDDIDLLVREKDWFKIMDLWNNGIAKKLISKDNRWLRRDIIMNGKSFILLMNKDNPGWLKLLNSENPDLIDIGGIDIGYGLVKDNRIYESMIKTKEGPQFFNNNDIQLYKFGHIEVMSVKYDIGKKYLDKMYPNWLLPEYHS